MFRRNIQKTKFIKSYEEEEIVERVDRLHPEETRHVERDI